MHSVTGSPSSVGSCLAFFATGEVGVRIGDGLLSSNLALLVNKVKLQKVS